MGISALVTAVVAGAPGESSRALTWWLADGVAGFLIGLGAIWRKSRHADVHVSDAVTRRFLTASLPALAAGALLTPVFINMGAAGRLPACWLLTYGAAVTSAGAYSIRVVPVLGAALMATGAASLLAPASTGHWFLAFGFGCLQMVFGWHIARRHGG
jgi:hypothetical protein